MADPIEMSEAYDDIGPELIAAGWTFEGKSVVGSSVTLTYERTVDGELLHSLVITDNSGSMARLIAIRRMREETFD